MYEFKIALRSLFYRKSQYVSLFLVCMFGLAISVTAICVSNGMIRTLSQKAKIYYGGDFTLMCSEGHGLAVYDYESKLEQIRKVLPEDAVVTQRIDYPARRNAAFYFEGTKALQQTIKGVEFDREERLLSHFNFKEGGCTGIAHTNAVLISAPIAELLSVHVGDEITLQLTDADDYVNTVTVEVRGIFQDSSAFGMYISYMDFDFLQEAYGRPKNYANRICVDFPSRTVNEKDLKKYYAALSNLFNFFPYVTDKDDYTDLQRQFTTETWGFIPLSANLNDVEIMQLAMDAVITFIVIILTLIIIAGIGSTYRVLIMKRITEVGIYMAVGMKKRAIVATLLFESLLLLIVGSVAGIALSALLCQILSVFDFSFIPSFDLFLEKGNLCPRVDVIKSVAVIVSVIFVTLLAVLYSTLKSIKIMPVEALAVVE